MPSEYDTKWLSSPSLLPKIDTQCPRCSEGIVEDNSFTSKKGVPFQSTSCKKCHTDWVVSQYEGEIIIRGIEDIKTGLKIINENIKTLIGLK